MSTASLPPPPTRRSHVSPSINKPVLTSLLSFILCVLCPSPIPSPPLKQDLSQLNGLRDKSIGINWSHLPSLAVIGFGLLSLCWIALLHICNLVKYVSFDTNLTLFKQKPKSTVAHLSLVMLGLLVTEYPVEVLIQLFLNYYPYLASLPFSVNLSRPAKAS